MKTLAKARILVTRFPYESRYGGEEVHTLTLMDSLAKRGFFVAFAGSDPVLLKEFPKQDTPILQTWLAKPPVSKGWLVLFTLLSPILFLDSLRLLFNARQRWKVDTVYMLSLGEKLMMTPWAILFGMKVLWLEHARIGNWLTKNPWRPWYSWWSRWVTVVVTSKKMEAELPFVRHVISVPCGIQKNKHSSPLPQEFLDFAKDHFCVGNVSRLTVDKGVDMMVRLVHSQPDIKLILVGTGPLEKLAQESVDADRILTIPFLDQSQLPAFYQALDLFVLASMEMDPFGMVAAEAMLAGTPTVVTDLCGISGDLKDGENARVISPRFASLDKAVKELKKNPELRKKMGARGKVFAEKNYDMELMVGRFEELIRR
ncbi:MAG: glycosyltransferase family 4 protein [Patescibacteria group bacterium]